jgi:signal peptidase I
MLPSLEIGDYVLVNKFAYGVRLPVLGTEILPVDLPKRGEVMVFKFPASPNMNYIKRVVGLPGDLIESRREVLFINGVEAKRELLSQEPAIEPWQQVWRENIFGAVHTTREEIGREPTGGDWSYTVPAGHYFVMGDNRDNSNDSRFWGPVSEDLIVGKAFYIWMHKKPGLNLPVFNRNGSIE